MKSIAATAQPAMQAASIACNEETNEPLLLAGPTANSDTDNRQQTRTTEEGDAQYYHQYGAVYIKQYCNLMCST